MRSSKLLQLQLLLVKNWRLQLRRKAVTVFEILLPVLFCAILLPIRTLFVTTNHDQPITFPSYSVDELQKSLVRNVFLSQGAPSGNVSSLSFLLAYAPNTTASQEIMSKVIANMSANQELAVSFSLGVEARAFASEEALLNRLSISHSEGNNKYLAGIIFSNEDNNIYQNVKIRMSNSLYTCQGTWRTDRIYPEFIPYGPRDDGMPQGPRPCYSGEGFLAIQKAILLASTQVLNPDLATDDDFTSMEWFMQRFPYPPYIEDTFVYIIQFQLPLLLMLSLIFVSLQIPKEIVAEKEAKLRESMKMMGLGNWLHWLAWFIKYAMLMTITVAIITFLIAPPWTMPENVRIFVYSDSSLVFVFLLLYGIATISFGFMVSVFFNTANVAAGAGGILFFCSYIPYFFISSSYGRMNRGSKLLSCLLHNDAMAIGTYLLGRYEVAGIGAKWSNFAHPVNADDDFSMGQAMAMLLFDSVIYLVITWYVEAVFPGSYGIPQRFYFPFQPSYWCGTGQVKANARLHPETPPEAGDQGNSFFEEEPVGLIAGVDIKGLTKEYKAGRKAAVDKMNLKMYQGQITALLGHNGAGKTSTMFMLTGFIPPTRGTAYVNGYDITKDITSVRSSLGLCPQHDILFDSLTVSEHLSFFGQLKGCKGNKVQKEIDYYLQQLDLEEKRNNFASTLSGGQKRKLSIAIALIGDSEIVILDEPTSGMDPSARRHMWNVLQNQRANRTMILSTHFMDEADHLGDRIAIMAEGVLKCCGTSLFLKKKYGAGYHMTMVKESTCDVQRVANVITKHVPEATMENNVAAELSFVLPHTQVSKFEGLFKEIEDNKVKLGISGYGASVTTMEEVFLKVADELVADKTANTHEGGYENSVAIGRVALDETHPAVEEYTRTGTTDVPTNGTTNGAAMPLQPIDTNGKRSLELNEPNLKEQARVVHDVKRNEGMTLQLQQFKAMFIKRIINTLRNKALTISQILVPVIFSIFACLVGIAIDNFNNITTMTLDTSGFPRSKPLFQRAANATALLDEVADRYATLYSAVEKVNVSTFISSEGEASIDVYTNDYIMASALSESNTSLPQATALYNSQPYHAAPISLSMMGNAILQRFTNFTNITLTFTNEQLPESLDTATADTSVSAFTLSIFIMFGMAFLASSFVVFLIRERHTKVKHIQYVSGVNPINFWLSTFCWDLINYLIPAYTLIIIFAAFNLEGLHADKWGGAMMLLLTLFGVAILPHMYLLQFLFITPATGYVLLTLYNVILGIFPPIVILVLDGVNEDAVKDGLVWFFLLLFPHYSFSLGLSELKDNYDQVKFCTIDLPNTVMAADNAAACSRADLLNHPCCKDTCGSTCINWQSNILAWESLGIGRPLVFLFISAATSLLLIILIESGLIRRLFYSLRPKQYVIPEVHDVADDPDVSAEANRIQHVNAKELSKGTSIVLDGITKYYNNFQAVESLYAEIPREECFGLLGVNGAGKTTTFKMLTGDESISGGTAYLNGHNVRTNITAVQKSIGYCPQFDALIDQMTGEETLYMYARLRGIPDSQIPSVVDDLLTALTLKPHANKQTREYSGGNKRKLSTAVALIGGPPIVFLDEPTTGMDPGARRMLWDTLTKVREAGKTLVLTSHSMEECEALCTRLAIMVNGRFKCLGSIQHLKTKYGEGYSLVARVAYPEDGSLPNLDPLKRFIEEKFPGSDLKDTHQNLLQYHITNTSLAWAYIFGTMERAKEEYNIEDYSVSQTTLEQVFINFARAQVPPREEVNKGCCSAFSRVCYCCIPETVVAPPKTTTL